MTNTSPRPWFLSLTAKWAEAEGFASLSSGIRGILTNHGLPTHHLPVAESSWHSTIYALLTIEGTQPDGTAPSALAPQLFQELRAAIPFLRRAAAVLPLAIQPHTLQAFDDGTTIQFEDHSGLAELRAALRPLIEPSVMRAIGAHQATKHLLDNTSKSNGSRIFGSIARSPSRSDGPHLRWRVTLPSLPPLQFRTMHFLVSDDTLTNTHDSSNSLRLTPP